MKAKKLLAALICSSVLIGGAVEAAGNGDVNGDGQVTQSDADLLLEYVRGRNVSINRNNADVNGDGTISVADVQGVLNKVRQQQQSGTLRVAYPSNGWYSLQPMCAPNKELTVENASTNKGANVFIWSINSNWHTQPSHQKWYIERIGNSEWYTIKAENSGLALNVDAGIGRDGTNITLWAKTDENQTFRFYDAGNGYYIIQGHTHDDKLFVLDVAAARNQDGTNVHIWHYNQGAPEQKWKLERRNPSSKPVQNGLLYPLKGNITVTSVSSSTNGYKCDYVTNGEVAIYAPSKGKVQFRQSYATRYNKLGSYGNNIRFYSDDGQYEIRLAHLSRFVGCRNSLKFNQTLPFPCGQSNSNYGPFNTVVIDTINVNPGDLIGYSGMTGNAKGHHIHIEVYKNGKAVDPKSVFTTW